MLSIKQIIKEEIETLIEVGEANLQPYDYKKNMWGGYDKNASQTFTYEFTTEDNDKYVAHIIYFNKVANVDFYATGYRDIDPIGMGGYGTVLNKGKIFRIMATLAKIVKEFVDEYKPPTILIEAMKSKGKDDMRRLNIYMAFIKKNLPNEYYVRYDDPYIILNRKIALKNIAEEDDYRGYHQAPGKDDTPMYDVTNSFGNDIYTRDAVRLFGTNEPYDSMSINIIQQAKDKPNQQIKIYRAIPKVITNQEKINDYEKRKKYILKTGKLPRDVTNWKNSSEYYDWLSNEIERLKTLPSDTVDKVQINDGDWVTINPYYAREHGKSNLGQYRVLTKTVPAKQLFTDGNSIHEWGYNIN